jgi:hypothetical protein
MNDRFDFISTTDKPALVACAAPAWLDAAKIVLPELGYKVHVAASHEDFLSRFSQVRYQVVILEDRFVGDSLNENRSLKSLQTMLMGQRRHAVIFLVGDAFRTLEPLQAFQHSVHAVINSAEMPMLKQLVEKIVAENTLFLYNFSGVQSRVSSV